MGVHPRLNAAGTTVILTTHYLEEAEQLCRNVAIIDHGRIIENTDVKSLLATLDKLGVRTVGTFLHLPAAGLLERFGERAHRLHRMASGALRPSLDPVPFEHVEQEKLLLTVASDLGQRLCCSHDFRIRLEKSEWCF